MQSNSSRLGKEKKEREVNKLKMTKRRRKVPGHEGVVAVGLKETDQTKICEILKKIRCPKILTFDYYVFLTLPQTHNINT